MRVGLTKGRVLHASGGCAERPFSLICVHSCVPTSARNGATVYTNAPKRRREAIFADLCTLLHTHGRSRDRAGPRVPRHRRPHGPRDARALGPEAHATGAVTPPPTHTGSRSLSEKAHFTKKCTLAADLRVCQNSASPPWTMTFVPENLRGTAVATVSQLRIIS